MGQQTITTHTCDMCGTEVSIIHDCITDSAIADGLSTDGWIKAHTMGLFKNLKRMEFCGRKCASEYFAKPEEE